MTDKETKVVRLGYAGFRDFFYRIVMGRKPAQVKRVPDEKFNVVISYDISPAAARFLARGTGVSIPDGDDFAALRVNFRGGNGYVAYLNASAKLIWRFARRRDPAPFEEHLQNILGAFAIGAPPAAETLAAPAGVPACEDIAVAEGDFDRFRLDQRWLFAALLPCDRAQKIFTEGCDTRRIGLEPPRNLYVEAVIHLKDCARLSCARFASGNDLLEQSIKSVAEIG